MRVVSLCPSLTELVFDLGRGDSLVGRTRYCVRPAGEVERVPALGGTKNPSLAEILALEPDLVLLNEEENRRQDAEALEAAGIPFLSSLPTDVAGAAAAVRAVGRALDAPGSAEEIARSIEEQERVTRAAAAGRELLGVAYLIWRKPWMAAGAGTYIDALLAAAGGSNVFAGRGERYPEVTAGEITGADPRAVLLASEPFPFARHHAEELALATGLAPERFVRVDGQALSWHGSSTIAGLIYARRLFRRLHLGHAGQRAGEGDRTVEEPGGPR